MAEQGNPRFRRDGRRRDQVVENEFTEKIISVNRVSKTVKGGRHFGFSVLVCVGDQKGKVGIAIGKAKAVPDAVRKGLEKARKQMVQIPLNKDTIAHPYICSMHTLPSPSVHWQIRFFSGPDQTRRPRYRCYRRWCRARHL